jgi:dipeptidyl aminopeptidase/acylaminoacyl peptidase
MNRFLILACLGAAFLFATPISYASDDKISVSADFPSFSPLTGEVVFSADFDGPTRLWIAQVNGTNLRKISRASELAQIYETEPALSPDGRQIAYVSINDGVSSIWIVQSDGAIATQLTANGANNTRPAWSPDGKRIVFVSDKDGTKDIWMMNSNGSAQVKIIGLAGEENRPSFSPAGDKIVFSETSGDYAVLMVAKADGSDVKALTSTGFQDWDPHWGENGIVFSSNRDRSSANWKLWIIQADGSGIRQVGNVVGLSATSISNGRILFTDETAASKAISSISMLNLADGSKRTVIDVQGYLHPIEIRPGDGTNNVNPKSSGQIEIAILSTAKLDALKSVNQATIRFGSGGNEQSLYKCQKSPRDVNNDGRPDLICHFSTNMCGFRISDKTGILRFTSNDGVAYEGRGRINIVGKGE